MSQDDRSIAYFSEKLNEAKVKYSTYDKEFYVVIQALKKWRHYLVPKEFVLYSDKEVIEREVVDKHEEILIHEDKDHLFGICYFYKQIEDGSR